MTVSVKPLVHLNGTGRNGLMEQLHKAHDAGRAFQHALAEMRPHGRDYYPIGQDAYSKARADHDEREAAVERVMADLAVLVEALYRP